MQEITIASLADLQEAARTFAACVAEARIIAFYGGMGAGKTTFIKALCETLGVTDNVTSPTFAIINEYTTGTGEPVYHFGGFFQDCLVGLINCVKVTRGYKIRTSHTFSYDVRDLVE